MLPKTRFDFGLFGALNSHLLHISVFHLSIFKRFDSRFKVCWTGFSYKFAHNAEVAK